MVKQILYCTVFLLVSCTSFAQQPANSSLNSEYMEWIKKANAFYDAKDYQASADAFSHAFAANGGKGSMDDRYNAGCTWSLAGNKDSAFFMLMRIATKGNFTDLTHLIIDPDLTGLHSDKRWDELCAIVKQNKDKAEANLDKPLVAMLDTVLQNDQQYRMQIDAVEKKYGRESKEMKALWKKINEYDSIDLIKVISVLDKYGWPGPDIVGRQGSQAIFLVIQHADIATQEKYLPVMREAVKNKKAQPSSLALLEDRVALGNGRKQIYGSQITMDAQGHYHVDKLEDVDNVDKRRASVGLGPLAEYVQQWNITWDPETFKKEQQEREKK